MSKSIMLVTRSSPKSQRRASTKPTAEPSQLLPGDLVCLPHFPKPNPKYGNTTKLFKRADVKNLAYRKSATIGGLEEGDNIEEFLKKGKKLLLPAVVAAAKSKAPEEA